MLEIEKLKRLKNRQYFKEIDWINKGLVISSNESLKMMRKTLTDYIVKIEKIYLVQKSLSINEIGKIILEINNEIYDLLDTEEQEWCNDIFLEIATEIGFDSKQVVDYLIKK